MNTDAQYSNTVLPLRGKRLLDADLSAYTTWRVGGRAKQLYQPVDVDDLANFIGQLPAHEPLAWIGLGSNLLVRDGGFDGTVIATGRTPSAIKVLSATEIYADCGVACNKLARTAAKAGMQGQEFLAGIPGSLGGALAMNAGAWQGEIWPLVESVVTVGRTGKLRERLPQDYQIGYRSVMGPENEWFVGATLSLQSGNAGHALDKIKQLLAKRNETQPAGLPSCGSVFRNPEGDHAARLIEQSGLKGYCIGDACVSDKHANFIINKGAARARDIESLIGYLQAQVRDKFDIELICEVRMIGDET